MDWQGGISIFGIGLAIVMWVATMIWPTFPRRVILFLLYTGFVLMLVWPVSAIFSWLNHASPEKPAQEVKTTGQLVVESMPSSSTIVPQGNQQCSAKVAKLAGLKVKNVGGYRITNVGIVVLKTNDFVGLSQPQLPVSSFDILFDCPNPPPVRISADLNPGDDAVFGAVIECNGTFVFPGGMKCPKGALAVPFVNNSKISFMAPVKNKDDRFDEFTVRASGDGVSAVTKKFEVRLTTDGSLALESGAD